MTFLSAAEAVLQSSKRPLTVNQITAAALRRGLINTHGKTPEATMSAALYMAAKNDPGGPIRREFLPGTIRAARDSVRWFWNGL